jgi:superfamily I DNA/RNA helicase
MDFLIADTFTDSLGRLTGDAQKAVKVTVFDLQANPASPGLSFHKLDKAKDKNFWSVRVNADIRLIVHRTAGSLLLCYVDHHDAAYAWAERRRLETHPRTGAAQWVEIRERVQEIMVPVYVAEERAVAAAAPVKKPALFATLTDEQLLSYGVPAEWMGDVRQANEDTLLAVAEHLPAEASEALLELATGGHPQPAPTPSPSASPFDHPDALRRFRVLQDVDALRQALDFPWDKWTIFLHPAQRQWVERDYSGPARVSGSAGTGKTIVALHRAVFVARRNPEARVLLTTFSDLLAQSLRLKLNRLIASEPRLAERLEVHSLDSLAHRLHKSLIGPVSLVTQNTLLDLMRQASAEVPGHKFSLHFLRTEWEQVVDAWQVASWEAYRDVVRLGRKTRLPEAQRAVLWAIFDRLRGDLAGRGVTTPAALFSRLAASLNETTRPPFDFAVIDEAQDLAVAHMKFFAALGKDRPNALFFAGDLGQRIFQQPFSWKALGVDIRGRSRNLKVNYRTSHQIRQHADRLLGPELADVDGTVENRSHTVSVFNGPPPDIRIAASEAEEIDSVAAWIQERVADGVVPNEIGLFVRSDAQIPRATAAAAAAGVPAEVLDTIVSAKPGHAWISTMHLAKGLEFRAVAVLACDDEIVPLQERIESVGDDADLEEVYDTERHLLYVACTRARDHLLLTAVKPGSEFLEDMLPEKTAAKHRPSMRIVGIS